MFDEFVQEVLPFFNKSQFEITLQSKKSKLTKAFLGGVPDMGENNILAATSIRVWCEAGNLKFDFYIPHTHTLHPLAVLNLSPEEEGGGGGEAMHLIRRWKWAGYRKRR